MNGKELKQLFKKLSDRRWFWPGVAILCIALAVLLRNLPESLPTALRNVAGVLASLLTAFGGIVFAFILIVLIISIFEKRKMEIEKNQLSSKRKSPLFISAVILALIGITSLSLGIVWAIGEKQVGPTLETTAIVNDKEVKTERKTTGQGPGSTKTVRYFWVYLDFSDSRIDTELVEQLTKRQRGIRVPSREDFDNLEVGQYVTVVYYAPETEQQKVCIESVNDCQPRGASGNLSTLEEERDWHLFLLIEGGITLVMAGLMFVGYYQKTIESYYNHWKNTRRKSIHRERAYQIRRMRNGLGVLHIYFHAAINLCQLLFVLIFPAGITMGVSATITGQNFAPEDGIWWPPIITICVVIVFVSLLCYITRRRVFWKVFRDVVSWRTKMVGKVSGKWQQMAKFPDTITEYWIAVEGRSFMISRRIYYWLSVGDTVVVNHWPNSGKVASVEKLNL